MEREIAEMADGASDARWARILAEAIARCREDAREAKQERSRRRKQDLLEAATRVFARDGIVKAKMADIAAEAGIPVSSIYEYFESKEELAYEIPLQHFGDFFAEFLDQAKACETSRERLRLFLVLGGGFAGRHPDWARLLYVEIWPSVLALEARVRQVVDDYARIVIELIREGGRRGEWDPETDAHQTAAILIGSLSQMIITWLLYGRPESLERGVPPLADRLLRLLDSSDPETRTDEWRQAVGCAARP